MRRKPAITGRFRATWITAVVGLVLVVPQGFSQGVSQSSRLVAALALERQIRAHDESALADADPVDRQLARYARRVPEMGFLRLYGEQASGVIGQLPALLGERAMNMDYEHDAASRGSLMDLQMVRIAVMVGEGLPSATLFKVGAGSAFEHAYLCVITLDTRPFRQDPRYATRFLTYDYADGYPVSNEQVLIANGDFLEFTVDHEVFHCLDAYFNGPPIRKAHGTMFSHYQTYVNEARADAFASELFKRKMADPDQFLETLAALRTLSVLALDPHHFTGDVIRHSVNAPPATSADTLQQQVATSRELVSGVVSSASRYAQRLTNTARVVGELGGDPGDLLLEFDGRKLPQHDDAEVAALLHELRQAQRKLEGSPVPSVRRELNLTQSAGRELE